MKVLAIILPAVFIGIMLVLAVRDIVKARTARTATAFAALDQVGKSSLSYIAIVMILGAALAATTYFFTGSRRQAVLFGAAVLLLGVWRKARMSFIWRISRKWVPGAPVEGFADDRSRLQWENKRVDLMLKVLPKAFLIVLISDLVLIGAIFLVSALTDLIN